MNETLPPATLWRRLLALVYDLMALLGLWFFIGLLAVAINHGPVGTEIADGAIHVRNWSAQIALYGALWLATGFYYALSWRFGGQTLGMRPWRLRVETADGASLNAARAWLRYLCGWLSLLPLGAGMLACLFDRDRRALHDLLTGTRIALLPKS
jgi:uncharacterized RDD family membrane protein YckC